MKKERSHSTFLLFDIKSGLNNNNVDIHMKFGNGASLDLAKWTQCALLDLRVEMMLVGSVRASQHLAMSAIKIKTTKFDFRRIKKIHQSRRNLIALNRLIVFGPILWLSICGRRRWSFQFLWLMSKMANEHRLRLLGETQIVMKVLKMWMRCEASGLNTEKMRFEKAHLTVFGRSVEKNEMGFESRLSEFHANPSLNLNRDHQQWHCLRSFYAKFQSTMFRCCLELDYCRTFLKLGWKLLTDSYWIIQWINRKLKSSKLGQLIHTIVITFCKQPQLSSFHNWCLSPRQATKCKLGSSTFPMPFFCRRLGLVMSSTKFKLELAAARRARVGDLSDNLNCQPNNGFIRALTFSRVTFQ